jgi:hypothetical protein
MKSFSTHKRGDDDEDNEEPKKRVIAATRAMMKPSSTEAKHLWRSHTREHLSIRFSISHTQAWQWNDHGLSIYWSMRPVEHSQLMISHAGGQDRLPTGTSNSHSGSNAVWTMSSLPTLHAFLTLFPLSTTRQRRKVGNVTMAVAPSTKLGYHLLRHRSGMGYKSTRAYFFIPLHGH